MNLPDSRDCTFSNIVLDPKPLFPQMFHAVRYKSRRDNIWRSAKYYSRTARPTKYYFIDFGISVHIPAGHLAWFWVKTALTAKYRNCHARFRMIRSRLMYSFSGT